MSIPAETPAAVMILPCSTIRRSVGMAPKRRRSSRTYQWLVAGMPSRIPAAPRSCEPVQTEVVKVVPGCTRRIQSMIGCVPSFDMAMVTTPPGTTMTSGLESSS
jgi:hypothetical protein